MPLHVWCGNLTCSTSVLNLVCKDADVLRLVPGFISVYLFFLPCVYSRNKIILLFSDFYYSKLVLIGEISKNKIFIKRFLNKNWYFSWFLKFFLSLSKIVWKFDEFCDLFIFFGLYFKGNYLFYTFSNQFIYNNVMFLKLKIN